MKSHLRAVVLCSWGLILLAAASPSEGYIAVPVEPVPNRVALVDCVLVGKITAINDKPIHARLYPHQAKDDIRFSFRTAELEVSEVLCGPKGKARVRLAFIGADFRRYQPPPAVGQEGCFYAVKHWDKDFYVVPGGAFLDKKSPSFNKDLKLTRRCCRLLEKPNTGLQSKDASDRLLTAYLLAGRYVVRPQRIYGQNVKAEPLDAKQSKLLLQALADADWSKPDPETNLSPQRVFGALNFSRGREFLKDFPSLTVGSKSEAAAQKWLRDNAASYRLKRLSAGPK